MHKIYGVKLCRMSKGNARQKESNKSRFSKTILYDILLKGQSEKTPERRDYYL